MKPKKHLAVLIDADNASACSIQVVMEEVGKLGFARTCRAYGDWDNQNKLKSWKTELMRRDDIEQIQQDVFTKGKNATDIRLAIDAIEMLLSREYDGFCIVSSDSDFTPLVSRLKQGGMEVYGFGVRQTPQAFVNACKRFIFVENLRENEKQEESGAIAMLHKLVDTYADKTGWALLSRLGQRLPKKLVRRFGYSRISQMFRAIPKFEMRTNMHTTGVGGAVYVRWKGEMQA
jgi:uncharacterized LabA/DUF88 family protein